MSFDAHKNFAVSAVAMAPTPAVSGTSLVVQAGEGALFPAAPFNVTIWPTGQVASIVNAEIARVTVVSGDTLTIVRAQEGTNARIIVAGDLIANVVSAKTLTDVEAPRLIPISHDDITGPSTTTSATLVDIPNSTVTITNTVSAILWVVMTVTVDLSSGSSTTVAIAVNIDGVDSNENSSFFSATGYQIMTKNECSGVASATPLSPGSHTIKGRYRIVSGAGTARVNSGEITAMFMQVL
jgi:hypothetical protein